MSRFDPPLGGVNPGAEFESVRIIKRPPPTPPEPDPTPGAPVSPDQEVSAASDDALTTSLAPSQRVADESDPIIDIPGYLNEADVLSGLMPGEIGAEASRDTPTIAASPDPDVTVSDGSAPIEPNPAETPAEEPAPLAKPRAIIVIDADAPADPMGPGSTDATGDRVDPRIRARRRQVQRAAGRKRFRVLIGIATAVVLVVGGSILLQSPLFSVRDVRIDGVHYADATAIKAVADGLYGQPLFRADLVKAQDEILLQPWVRRVRIIRTWPRSITIDIAERTPIGAVPTEDQAWRVIDIEGRVLAITDGQPKDFMAIRGDPKPVEVGGVVSPQMISGARLADSLPGRLKSITREVIVGGDGAVALEISPKGRILLGTIDDLRAKLISVLTFLDSCPGVQFETLDARAATALVMSPPNCRKAPLTKKAP